MHKKIKRNNHIKINNSLIVIAVALFGSLLMGVMFAVGNANFVSIEPEINTLVGSVTVVPNATASNASAVKFGNITSAHFSLLPVGVSLPSGSTCASLVRRNNWEYDSQNTSRNLTVGHQLQNSYIHQIDTIIANRVDGNFTGTTDEIIQWGACKWGFDEDDVRAQAVAESTWHQYFTGDCGNQHNTQFGYNGCESVGLLQVRGADIPATHPGTWPDAYDSTAFNVDYSLAIRRLCFEGKETWLGPSYVAGDLWGCIGRWYSGGWYNNNQNYINTVQQHLQNKPWVSWGYPG